MERTFTKQILFSICLTFFCGALNAQVWSKTFTAGNYDSNNKFLGGSEVLQLVNHKDMLFASVGYWEDGNNIWYGGSNNGIGWGQINRLVNPSASWQEDLFMGANYLRPEILKQIIFTKDQFGNPLSSPDTLLISAGYSPNFITSAVTVKSFVRNDLNGTWGESQIVQGSFPGGSNYSVRDIQVYNDQLTGFEYVFATVGTQGIYKGKYNPAVQGKIDWISTPEYGPLSIRPLGIAEANDNLYFSSGNKLYKRVDGISPTYAIAHDFSDLSTNINSAVGGIRGLTTIENPNGNDEALLLMWCPDGQSKGIIYRLEPNGTGGFIRIYETKLSLLIESLLPGTTANYVLGAYNEFYQYINPITSDTTYLVGFEAQISGGGHPTWNGYYSGGLFAERTLSGQYSIEEINGTIGTNDTALVANRCYVSSPFPNENAIYFGGFDPNSNTATSMAWIFKKDYQTTSVNEQIQDEIKIIVYPNPVINRLNVKVKTNELIKYDIISVLGETLISGFVSSGNHSIDISKFTSNIYFIRIENQIIKFIKIK